MANGDITNPTIPQGLAKASVDNFTTLSAIYNKINKPDYREDLVKIFGSQQVSGINGLLRMVGATKAAGTNDTMRWWEEERLHLDVLTPSASTAITDVAADPMTITFSATHKFIGRDTLLLYTATNGSARPIRVQVVDADPNSDGLQVTVRPYKNWPSTLGADAILRVQKFANEFGQGTNQPTEFLASDAIERTNTYYILKTVFAVTGSQMTNIGWIKDPETGSNLWYHKQEGDFRKRTEDYDEMFSILGDQLTNSGLEGVAQFNQNGSEGLFSAIESRGINFEYYIEDLEDIDNVIRSLDKQAGVGEYAMYVNRQQDQFIDNLLGRGTTASGTLAAGVQEQYGTFNNSKDMAIALGFASFYRNSYTFHKHDWKLLNDPQLLGAEGTDYYKAVMIPMTFEYTDAKTGMKSPTLEINYKGAEGYNRDMEFWRGGAVPQAGYKINNFDRMEFNYRCEKLLATRGANNCVLFAGGTPA